MPADKLVLGLGAYGHGFRVNSSAALGSGSGSNGSTSSASASASLNMYPAFNASDLFQGSSWDDDPPVDVCGNAQSPGGTYTFWSMITEAGLLDETGAPREGIVYGFDNCSQTVRDWFFFSSSFFSPNVLLDARDSADILMTLARCLERHE